MKLIPKYSKKNMDAAFLLIMPFLLLFLLSRTLLKDMYLFRWTADHYYSYMWMIVFWGAILDKIAYAASLSVGNVIGILLGQFVGDYIHQQNMMKITESMTAGQQYQLAYHPGTQIWMGTMMLCLVLGILIRIVVRQRKRKAMIQNSYVQEE